MIKEFDNGYKEKFLPPDDNTSEKTSSPEVILPEVDDIVRNASTELMEIDKVIGGDQHSLDGLSGPVIDRFKNLTRRLEGMSSEQLLSIIDPSGALKSELFSAFKVTGHPPGAIHVELGTTDDLVLFKSMFKLSTAQLLTNMIGSNDARNVDTFTAQYFRPTLFETNEFLGVIATVADKFKTITEKENAVLHEYSHAITRQVVRPIVQHTVVDVDFTYFLSHNRKATIALGEWAAQKLAQHLDVEPKNLENEEMVPLIIGKNIRDEIFLMDELRAYTFNRGILPPKYQMTDIEFEGDSPKSAMKFTRVKFFELYLTHTKARLTSRRAQAQSLSVLGSALSLRQANRLINESTDWSYDPADSDERFIWSIEVLSKIFELPNYTDFRNDAGNELLSMARVKQILMPSREQMVAEITRRWGSVNNAPPSLLLNFSKLYTN